MKLYFVTDPIFPALLDALSLGNGLSSIRERQRMQNKLHVTNAASSVQAIWSLVAWLALVSSGLAADPSASDRELFEKRVRPLFIEHCYECHSGRKSNGGLVLDTREGLLKGGDSGAALIAGDPEKSRLIEAVRYKNSDLQMPPKNRLAASEVELLEKWIANGAFDPREVIESEGAPAPVGMSIEEGKQFWSFRPVSNPPLPVVHQQDWVRTPIDAFLLAKLEASGLKPAAPADKRTLIRRVTFDLIGLPPTPEEIEAFIGDESPDAFRNVCERLLDSPGYGVRWGRHWLDVARYADSNGLDENLAYGNAWRYRDYVVNAFNNNKPFNRFLIEQLAGDLVPEANQETKTATAFLVLGAKVLAEPDREKLEMDTIDEQLDSMSKAFLGMTFGCVRCHDHKFDPIKQTDYYALGAILKSTRTFASTNTGAIKHWNEYSFATDEELTKVKALDKVIAEKQAAAANWRNQATEKLRVEARAKATDYLVAAAHFEPDMPLTQVEEIARPLGLHPRILHHCRLHLARHPDDPLLVRWHELVAAGDLAGIERHFRPLFEGAEAALAAARKANPSASVIDDPRLELARAALYDASGLLAVPPKPEFAFDAATLDEYNRLATEARLFESQAADAASAMGVADGTVQTELAIHIRGSHRNLGKPVKREFPEVMRTSSVRPILPVDQSGRLELAQWLASTEHPLTARVFVNRIWRWHFGVGIVASTENFGKLGDRPSHPELLDFLARHFMEHGWSIKELHRLILASNAYQMSSVHADEPAAVLVDAENRLLWKFRLQRLDAEQIRDSILAVSGRLDTSIGGKSIPLRNRQFVFDHTSIDHTKYDSLRRAIYLPIVRNNVYTMFDQFDFPDPTMPTGHRNATVVAPQALLMMNSDLIMDSANAFAARIKDYSGYDAARINRAYDLAFGRSPTEAESQRALVFLGENAPAEVWSLFCQSLFASNEFIYLR